MLTPPQGTRVSLVFQLLLLLLLMMMMVTMTVASGPVDASTAKEKRFKDDVDVQDPDTGEALDLHSEGRVAQMVELDLVPEVKRVACVGDRLILKMTDPSPARGWRVGQVVVGGPEWGCNATRHNGFRAQAIYVKLVKVTFPLDTEVVLHHVPAGPFDMLEEARIHFHYDPGKKTTTRRYPDVPDASLGDKPTTTTTEKMKPRVRRGASLSNLVSNILNQIDWQANVSASIPFSLGGQDEGEGTSESDFESMSLALHKGWGQKNLSLTRGQNASEVKDDFVLYLDNLNGNSELTYTFDLEIKNINGEPQIVKYINQYDVQANLEADATIRFEKEMGVTYNVTLTAPPPPSSAPVELLRVPVVRPRGGDPPLPPVYLVVSYSAVSLATVSAYSAGRSSLATAFNASGFVTASQRFDPVTNLGSNATSRDWSVHALERKLRSPYRTHVDFSVYQQLFFTSALSWHYRDVDIELSPPMEVTVRPEVKLRSSSPGVSRCVNSAVTVNVHVHAGRADFTADAFGLHLWDVPVQPAMTRDLHLIDGDLGQGCDARCHGPRHVSSEALNTSQPIRAFGRQDPEFSRLRAFTGDQVLFHDDAENATWCGDPAMPCQSCSQHATNTSASVTCAARLMTSRSVAALTLLADMVSVEWPDKRVQVLEAWDEATSRHPTGRHQEQHSLYRAGRALTLTLADPQGPQADLHPSPPWLERLAQLAVCAGFELVEPMVSETEVGVRVGVAEDGWSPSLPEHEEERESFWRGLDSMDVSDLSPKCPSAPRLSVGDTWGTPQQTSDPTLKCGPVNRPLHRGDRTHMNTLILWNLTDEAASMTFEAEGQATGWCGYPSRPCRDRCDTPSSDDLEPWDWCSARMMTPRLAIRLRRLQKLAEEKNIDIHVLQAFAEPSEHHNVSLSLYQEGRAVKLTSSPSGQLAELASLAVCAGFDVVSFTSSAVIELFVKAQSGFRTVLTSYFEGPLYPMVSAVGSDDKEYSYPFYLRGEEILPMLLDGGFPFDTPLSKHVRLGDVVSIDRRYFRLDPSLLECLELAEEDFSGRIEVLRGSVYRTRSENVRRNIDLRHPQELWRFQAGQAMELRPAGALSSERLLALATSILRECPPLVRLQMRAVGLGCHSDRIYVDLRPLEEGHEREYVAVWEEGETGYCQHVKRLQRDMIEGGPVVQSEPDIACRDRQLDPGLEFLSFQLGQKSHCQVEGQDEFCRNSRQARQEAAQDLQKLLMEAAGHGRLDKLELHHLVNACLLDLCGGCPGVGAVFDSKVRACSRLVHYYVSRAARPLPLDIMNRTAFFNLHTRTSTVQALACSDPSVSVCVENTPLYSLFAPTVTARYYPNLKKALEREMFAADVNPTPLLELVSQEVAIRAKGKVTVYVESESDLYALRNTLKVLMVYNKDVSRVEFHVTPDVDKDLVTSSVRRKLEAWSGVACPRFSRFALTPFAVVTMERERHRRSAEQSLPRNEATARIYDWEREWLNKLL